MSWFKDEVEHPSQGRQNNRQQPPSQQQTGTSFFTDPQSYNEKSRSVQSHQDLANQRKDDFIYQQQESERKREAVLASKRGNANQTNERRLADQDDADEKELEKLRKQQKQREYQNELMQQMQDNKDRKDAERNRDNSDNMSVRSPFNSGNPQNQRDITNEVEYSVAESQKVDRRERQELYARELASQVQDQRELKSREKQTRNDYGGQQVQQNNYKQQEADHYNQYDNQYNQGNYQDAGPSHQQYRDDYSQQSQDKAYDQDFDRYSNRNDVDASGRDGRQGQGQHPGYDVFGNVAAQSGGKASRGKDDGAFDVFGNPVRQTQKQVSQSQDLDIFGNPARSKRA